MELLLYYSKQVEMNNSEGDAEKIWENDWFD